MDKLTFHITIQAPKEKVWTVMLSDGTYREWTAAFHEGSYFEGSWEEGSDIRFLAEDDGKLGGMVSRIAKNIPYEYVSIEHLGEVVDGKTDLFAGSSRQWIGAHENYIFSEVDGVTSLTIELEGEAVSQEMADMFKGMWPAALSKLKEIAERS